MRALSRRGPLRARGARHRSPPSSTRRSGLAPATEGESRSALERSASTRRAARPTSARCSRRRSSVCTGRSSQRSSTSATAPPPRARLETSDCSIASVVRSPVARAVLRVGAGACSTRFAAAARTRAEADNTSASRARGRDRAGASPHERAEDAHASPTSRSISAPGSTSPLSVERQGVARRRDRAPRAHAPPAPRDSQGDRASCIEAVERRARAPGRDWPCGIVRSSLVGRRVHSSSPRHEPRTKSRQSPRFSASSTGSSRRSPVASRSTASTPTPRKASGGDRRSSEACTSRRTRPTRATRLRRSRRKRFRGPRGAAGRATMRQPAPRRQLRRPAPRKAT